MQEQVCPGARKMRNLKLCKVVCTDGFKQHNQQSNALCACSGAASSREEAERVCEAINTAGGVLRVQGLVYLRPLDVADTILKVPSS